MGKYLEFAQAQIESYHRTSDADIIAVQFPHVFEPTGGQQDDWDEQFERWAYGSPTKPLA
jgi:hypothetical protein